MPVPSDSLIVPLQPSRFRVRPNTNTRSNNNHGAFNIFGHASNKSLTSDQTLTARQGAPVARTAWALMGGCLISR